MPINMPVRGSTGHNWSSHYMSFVHGPQEYAAIHFHDESVDDARWKKSFSLTIPKSMKSGVYAARLRVKGKSTPDHEDYIRQAPTIVAAKLTQRLRKELGLS